MEKEKINFFGYKMSRREIRWNGIIFIMFNIIYSVVHFLGQVPEGINQNPELLKDLNIQGAGFLPIVLFIIGYAMIHYSYFYNRNEEMIEKFGIMKYYLIKLLFIFSVVMFNAFVHLAFLLSSILIFK